jgi:hypothetical protein
MKLITAMRKLFAKLAEALSKRKTDPPKPPEKQDEDTHGFTHPAQIVASIFDGRWAKDGVYFSYVARNWTVDREDCDGEAWLGVRRNGQWLVGKFDKIRPKSTSRDWKNIYDERPYGKWIGYGIPRAGEEVCMFVVNFAHNQRTNAIFGVWQ